MCNYYVTLQVGEIEEQLTAARREVTKSEEANQKLQRDVKEVNSTSQLVENTRVCQHLIALERNLCLFSLLY